MSRSYRKFLSQEHGEFTPPDWKKFRVRERRCICRELHNTENGEIIFPNYYGLAHKSWYCSKRWYYSKMKIRNEYFKEMRNILNGYQDCYFLYSRRIKDYLEIFTKEFYRIKNGTDEENYRYKWLNTREAIKAIKNWDGDPLDVLYYLTNTRIIEKAVRNECKRMLRK